MALFVKNILFSINKYVYIHGYATGQFTWLPLFISTGVLTLVTAYKNSKSPYLIKSFMWIIRQWVMVETHCSSFLSTFNYANLGLNKRNLEYFIIKDGYKIRTNRIFVLNYLNDDEDILIISRGINMRNYFTNNVHLYKKMYDILKDPDNVEHMWVPVTNFPMVMVNFRNEEESLFITLKSEKYNFYFVDNILCTSIFKYILDEYYPKESSGKVIESIRIHKFDGEIIYIKDKFPYVLTQ
jgi:hypothetical protein